MLLILLFIYNYVYTNSEYLPSYLVISKDVYFLHFINVGMQVFETLKFVGGLQVPEGIFSRVFSTVATTPALA